jgi:DNA-binding transcriptional ArsR family regulator
MAPPSPNSPNPKDSKGSQAPKDPKPFPGRAGTGLAALASLLADETRATFCLALLDGRAWTAGELARYAGVAPSTASEHLGKLIAGGLLSEERQGRHRYVRFADAGSAHVVEDLAAHTAHFGRRGRAAPWPGAAPATTISRAASRSPSPRR